MRLVLVGFADGAGVRADVGVADRMDVWSDVCDAVG